MNVFATKAEAEEVAQRLTATRVGRPAVSHRRLPTRVTRYEVEQYWVPAVGFSNGFYGIVEHWEYVGRPDFSPGSAFLDADNPLLINTV
jgi:hypothetical protein